MNDLMTKSFLSYVELKKQALKDFEAEIDLEAGSGLSSAEERNLSQFFEEVGAIQALMGDMSGLLVDLRQLRNEAWSAHSAKVLRGLRDRMDSDMVSILRKAKIIKGRLDALDQSNSSSRCISEVYMEGSPVDRTRMLVMNGLSSKLREMMNEFQNLREQIIVEHKEDIKRRYFSATGEVPTEEMIEKMSWDGGQADVLKERLGLDLEGQERQKAVVELKRSLTKLHQVFLDMAVMVETQQDQLNDIEENVVRGRDYISGGTDRLVCANAMKKKKSRSWMYWVWILVVILVLVCLLPIFTDS